MIALVLIKVIINELLFKSILTFRGVLNNRSYCVLTGGITELKRAVYICLHSKRPLLKYDFLHSEIHVMRVASQKHPSHHDTRNVRQHLIQQKKFQNSKNIHNL